MRMNSVKQEVIQKLEYLYPVSQGVKIFDEVIPENGIKPYFLLSIINYECKKRLNTKYFSTISFDLSYYSDKSETELKEDIMDVCQNLLRELELVGTYRTKNKKAVITDNVLHITFDIQYSELKLEEGILMQDYTANTTI